MLEFNMNDFFLPSHPSNLLWNLIKRLWLTVRPPVSTKKLAVKLFQWISYIFKIFKKNIQKYSQTELCFVNLHEAFNFSTPKQQELLQNKIFPFIIKLIFVESTMKEFKAFRKMEVIGDIGKVTENFTALDVAVVMAHAFLCTFPPRPKGYNEINFYSLYKEKNEILRKKLYCIFAYFNAVSDPQFIKNRSIELTRAYVKPISKNEWIKSDEDLLEITYRHKDYYENLSKYQLVVPVSELLGGGSLSVKENEEEIRFITCPELLMIQMMCESLGPNEALFMRGFDIYSKLKGNSFKFDERLCHDTRRDSSGNISSHAIFLDPLPFTSCDNQYSEENIIKELNKLYAGFYNYEKIPDIIDCGPWGCWYFITDMSLKAFLILMAAAKTKRKLNLNIYNDSDFKNSLEIYQEYLEDEKTVGEVLKVVLKCKEKKDLFEELPKLKN